MINGDIFCASDIFKLKSFGLGQGFMIGRGAIHNIKIFEEFKDSFDIFELEEENRLIKEERNFDDLENDVDEFKNETSLNENSVNDSNLMNKDIREKEIFKISLSTSLMKHEPSKRPKGKEHYELEDENDIKMSNNLARVFDLKYQGRKIDIKPIIRDYIINVKYFFIFNIIRRLILQMLIKIPNIMFFTF